MAIVVPKFRNPTANYYFLADERGSIVAVVYPDGDRPLRAGEADQ